MVQNDLKQIATTIELYLAEHGDIPHGDGELSSLGITVAKDAYSILFTNSSNEYNLLYCSPDGPAYTLIARSKSGNAYRYGTTGVGEFAVSSSSTTTICASANVPTADTLNTSRSLFYENGWRSWLKG